MLPSAAVWLENAQGEVLFQRRSQLGDNWGFPGGNMARGESLEETAIREALEETGLQIRIRELIGVYSRYVRTLPNGHQTQSITSFFRGEIIGGELYMDEVETFGLGFFDPLRPPPMEMQQHIDMPEDARSGLKGVFR